MTPELARDEMLAVFKTAWDGTGYAVAWPDNAAAPPATEEPWARVTLRHADGMQGSLSGPTGARLQTYIGTLWVELYIPKGQGVTMGYALARLVLEAFRAARGAVWYRKLRFREAGDDGAYSRVIALIDFTYDDQ